MTAVARRWLHLIFSMFVDDGAIQDSAGAKGSGQQSLRELFSIFGTPFATEKQKDMAKQQDFIGLVHDLSRAHTDGVITFSPRPSHRQARNVH